MRILHKNTAAKLVAFLILGCALTILGSRVGKSFDRSSITPDFEDGYSKHALISADGMTIPAGSWGVAVIDNAREGNLLHLRGIAGEGRIYLRTDDTNKCLVVPADLVAGDFGGNRIGIYKAGPIRLTVNSRSIAETLKEGEEVISDEVSVGDRPDDGSDITLLAGLQLSHGFVLSPNWTFRQNVFGWDRKHVSCRAVDRI